MALIALAGCSPAVDKAPAKPLVLTIGALVPATGSFVPLAAAENAGIALAVQEIAKADLGITVKVETRDSGDAATAGAPTAVASVTDLLKLKVSAIVGPTGSDVTKVIAKQVTDAGVVLVSPQNDDPTLTTLKDGNLFWRTAPSDALVGAELARRAAADGAKTLGILWLKDDYGTAVEESMEKAFEATGGKVVAQSILATDADVVPKVASIAKSKPDAVVLLTTGQTAGLIPALVTAGIPAKSLYFTDRNLLQYGGAVSVPLTGATGILSGPTLDPFFVKRLKDVNPGLTNFSYSAESYDAVVLLALAALQAHSTDGKKIAANLRAVSGGTGKGEKASDFASAAQIIIGGDPVNYQGASGDIDFDKNGDPGTAPVTFCRYIANNTYAAVK